MPFATEFQKPLLMQLKQTLNLPINGEAAA